MTILLPAFGVAFAACAVWLTVRIVNRRERWAKRLAAIIFALGVYGLSWGPACWFCVRVSPACYPVVDAIYSPLGYLFKFAPIQIRDSMFDTLTWWMGL